MIHFELPRGLSLTVRACGPPLADLRRVDTSFDFWRWMLDDERTGWFAHLADIARRDAKSTCEVLAPARALVKEKCDGELWGAGAGGHFRPWFERLCAEHAVEHEDIVSLGIDSSDALALAGHFASFLRERYPNVRVCLSKHQHESFSLSRRLPDSYGELLRSFDAVVHYEEKAAEAIEGLARYWSRGDERGLSNVAVTTSSGPRLIPPTSCPPRALAPSFDDTIVRTAGVPAGDLVWFTPLVRNDCYYGRCTFCSHNDRYLAPQLTKHGAELERALAEIDSATKMGIRSFSFSDQAIHPKLARRFARALRDRREPISWCGRMLFDPHALDDDLLAELRAAGCRELLFGVESMRRETRVAMDKDLDYDETSARALLDRLARHGIDCVLSFIHGFPSESDEHFEESTLPFIVESARRSNVTIFLNRFDLHRGTPIARDPARWGIREVFPRGGFDSRLDYVDAFGRDSRVPSERAEAYCAEVFGETDLVRALVTYVDHSSLGLRYRWHNGRSFSVDAGIGPRCA